MSKLTDALIADLTEVAEKHGMSYTELRFCISDDVAREDRLEDIKYVLNTRYEDVVVNDDNLELIYSTLEHREDAEYGVWDNITNAIDWVYDDLEKKEEA